jgi:mono/diheme cytochrome c family protein
MTEALVLWLTLAAAPAADGEQAFRSRCTECHTVRALHRTLRKRPAAGRAAYLEGFLPKHYAPDAAERKAIVEYLAR